MSLILGGTATRMEDLVSAYSAFARKGYVSPLRFKPTDEIRDRALMSPGAAWIVRRIMGGEARPVPEANLSGQLNLAWKTEPVMVIEMHGRLVLIRVIPSAFGSDDRMQRLLQGS